MDEWVLAVGATATSDWERAWVEALLATGRQEEAQLIEWKELRYAARLVLERSQEIDGNLYFVLDPAAKALEGKQPLAAALLRRAMIEDTLAGAKATRYRHAARHLLECRTLEAGISNHGSFETHDAFMTRLRAQHGRKTGFWSQVAEHDGVADRR